MALSIGDLSKQADVKVTTIRYYERIGLLAPPDRTEGGHRSYHPRDLERLRFIRHARDLGFEIEAIRELIAISEEPHRSCEAVDAIARRTLAEVHRRIEQLQALERELTRMADACAGGDVSDCRIMAVLGNHALCEAHGREGPAARS